MIEKIKSLSDYFNKENENPSSCINSDLFKKYSIYKNWLIENGAIFSKNIDFPYTYGPFNLIGCKSVSDINEKESILLVPKKLMIISRELSYLDEYIEDIEGELYEDCDMATLYLTLHLCFEINNKKSFFRPYFDLILYNHNFLDDFTEENLKLFDDDDKIILSIKEMMNELDELYDTIKEGKYFKNISKKEFLFCYSQVVSRQFFIDKNCTALIPLADLLNHNNLLVHYELYDSENYIFKYTDYFTVSSDKNKDIVPTSIKQYPNNNIIKNEIKPFIFEKKEDDEEENEEKIKINENDYFSISTSKGQKILKGKQVFNNYYNGGNKYLLKNYGFCLIDNIYDHTLINFNFEKGKDIYLNKYLEIVSGKNYKTDKDPFFNIVKIKIYFNEANFFLVKYYRFFYFYESVKDIKQYVIYKFDINLEISFISLAIERLKLKFNGEKIEEINELENELFNNKEKKLNGFKINVLIYRITQKRNILNQIDLMEFILKIMKKYKNEIKSYKEMLNYIDEFVNITKYDTDENSKIKIIKFIIKSHNFVS